MTLESNPVSLLRWSRISFTIENIRKAKSASAHPLEIIQAILKGAITGVAGDETLRGKIIFRPRGISVKSTVEQSSRFHADALFCGTAEPLAEAFPNALAEYLSTPEGGKNFRLANVSQPQMRSVDALKKEHGEIINNGEVCLDFFTPVPFHPQKGRDRTYISKENFVSLLASRLAKLFGNVHERHKPDGNFQALPFYWNYTEIRHNSKSQPGSEKYINGCFGPLYLKGMFDGISPYLLLGAELGAGGKTSYGMGHFNILRDSSPFFSRFFPSAAALKVTFRETAENYDAITISETPATANLDENDFCKQAARSIASGEYEFAPYAAFVIPKKNGMDRVAERLSFHDLVVQTYILRTVTKFFDRALEEESIGFRKGRNRESAIGLIRECLSQEYNYLVETDIEDFFPSINHATLERILAHYLPEKDSPMREMLMKAVRASYSQNSKIHERTIGLAQGSPLSPILANLYLDEFDEQIKSLDVRLIRYADDFIILARSKEEAEKAFESAKGFLGALGLKLKKEKTFIRPVGDGFSFLGVTFTRSETRIEPEEEYRKLKKPLYVTMPYVMLSLNGGAVDIVKDKKVVETAPLRRISEIILMDKAVFSTALAARCVQMRIPISITLGSAYYVTTIKPDSRQFYVAAGRHEAKFNSISDAETLLFAKEFAAGKLANYATLFSREMKNRGAVLKPIVEEMLSAGKKAYAATDINALRGVEGAAAKKVYKWLNEIIDDPSFHITGRRRENPDMINSLLNFGYYLLFGRVNATLRVMGLNPYLGFLHSSQNDYESLACDVEELFRARVDRIIIRMVNLKIITVADFAETDKGIRLSSAGVKKFINQYEAEMDRKKEKSHLSLKERIYLQCLVVKNWALEEKEFSFYRWKKEGDGK